MRVGDTIVMLADASTAEGVSGPMPATWSPTWRIARRSTSGRFAAGATTLREPQDMFYGDRSAGVVDPLGNHR
jgi:PhnB protein